MKQVLLVQNRDLEYGVYDTFLGGPIPTLYMNFPDVRVCVLVRTLVETVLTMPMKIKVVSLDV